MVGARFGCGADDLQGWALVAEILEHGGGGASGDLGELGELGDGGSRPYRAWWLRAAARARTRGAGLPAEPGAWLGCTTGCSTGWTGLSNGREEIGCGSAAPSDAFMLDACCTGGLDGLDALSNCVLSRLDGGVGRVAAGCSTVGHAGLDGGSGAAGLTRRCQPGRGSVRGGEQVDQVGDDRGGDRGPGADSEPEQGGGGADAAGEVGGLGEPEIGRAHV